MKGEGAPKGAHTDTAAKQVNTDDTSSGNPAVAGDGYQLEAELRLGTIYRLVADVVAGDVAASTGLCDQVGILASGASKDLAYARARRSAGPKAALEYLRRVRP